MDRADLAIYISLGSAFVTAGGLIWQIALYRLSGARLNVALRPCIVDEFDTIFRGPPKGWAPKTPDRFRPASGLAVELAEMTVTNVGRTAVSVRNLSLDVGGERWNIFKRWTISGVPIVVADGISENRCRLEPGDSVTIYFDLWRVVDAARERRDGVVVVRASAEPVSRRPKRSPWLQRWKVQPHAATLHPELGSSVERNAYLDLWRSLHGDPELSSQIRMTWAKVRAELRRGGDVEDIMNAITAVLGKKHALLAIGAAEQVHGTYHASDAIDITPASTD